MSNIQHEAPRPYALDSSTRCFEVPHYLPPIKSLSPLKPDVQRSPITVYFTVVEDGNGKPFEIFFHDVSDPLLFEMLATIAVFGSRLLRLGGKLDDLADDMEEIITQYAHYKGARFFKSIVAHVGHEIRQYNARREGQLMLELAEGNAKKI